MAQQTRSTAVRAATVVAALTAVIAAGTVGAAVGIQQAVRDASRAQSVEAALGANDVAAKAVVQALLVAEEREFGLADDDVLGEAIAEARKTLDELVADVERIPGDTELPRLAVDVADAAADVLAAAEAGEVVVGARVLQSTAVPAFEVFRDEATVLRDTVVDDLGFTGSIAGLAGVIAAFLVALVLPGGFVLVYRSILRRQLRTAQIELDARLAAEREISRSRDEFIANISHELRTPLTSIYGFSEVLLEEQHDETTKDLVTLINRETSELGRMVEDLLVSAGLAESEMSFSLEPASVAEEVAQVVEPLAWHDVDIVTDLEEATVVTDRLRLRQIVRNLVSNGLKHGEPPVWVVGWVNDSTYTLVVTDHGDGIPDHMMDRVFSRFVHEGAAPLTAGSVGLGLAVAKHLAEGIGGDLGYARVDDRTEFVVTLPLAPVAEPLP